MSTSTDRVVRISAELYDDAARTAERESRSTRQQLEHWVRIGRSVTQQADEGQSRIEAAFAGALRTEDLTPAETDEFEDAMIDRIRGRLADIDFVAQNASLGFRSVTLGADGEIIEHLPTNAPAPTDTAR